MKLKKLSIIALLPFWMQGVTIVYNMRVAMVTKRQKLDVTLEHPQVLAGTAFRQWREFLTGAKQTTAGALGTYIYARESYYLKIDSAVGHVNTKTDALEISRTQSDDILFTGGYGHPIGNKWRLAYSGLFGIPTHRDVILELAQFGTGHYGTGAQLDSSYNYRGNHSNVIFGAARFIHFFPRNIQARDPRTQPLFPCCNYKLKLGNLVDLFISHQTNWKQRNRFEFGYDATFGFSSDVQPPIVDFAGSVTFIRHNFFGAYFRHVPIGKVHTGIITGLSYGFDSKPELIGNRYFITLWGLWGVIF